MNSIIIDRSEDEINDLSNRIKNIENLKVVGTGRDIKDGFKLIEEYNPDIIFTDTLVCGDDCIEEYRDKFLNSDIAVIFTSNSTDKIIDSYSVDAVDYLIKPIDGERLENAISKAKRHHDMNKKTRSPKDMITLRSKDSLYPVKVEDINFITIRSKETTVYTSQGIYLSNRSLINFEEILDGDKFIRTHRSYIVNKKSIEKIDEWFNSTYVLKVRNSEEKIPVSRGNYNKFRRIMNI